MLGRFSHYLLHKAVPCLAIGALPHPLQAFLTALLTDVYRSRFFHEMTLPDL
jgi:hypothetical protein